MFVAVVGLFIPQYAASVFMLVLTIVMFFLHKIDDFLARHNFHKSPHCNTLTTMRFSDLGLHATSEVQDSTLKWKAFSRAVIFNDGVLIFQGPKVAYWIPDSALEQGGDALSLCNLVIAMLPTNQAVYGSGVNVFSSG